MKTRGGECVLFFNLKVAERALNLLLLTTPFFDGSERAENTPAHSLFWSCPLLGVKRTCLFALQMSAFDPKRTPERQKEKDAAVF